MYSAKVIFRICACLLFFICPQNSFAYYQTTKETIAAIQATQKLATTIKIVSKIPATTPEEKEKKEKTSAAAATETESESATKTHRIFFWIKKKIPSPSSVSWILSLPLATALISVIISEMIQKVIQYFVKLEKIYKLYPGNAESGDDDEDSYTKELNKLMAMKASTTEKVLKLNLDSDVVKLLCVLLISMIVVLIVCVLLRVRHNRVQAVRFKAALAAQQFDERQQNEKILNKIAAFQDRDDGTYWRHARNKRTKRKNMNNENDQKYEEEEEEKDDEEKNKEKIWKNDDEQQQQRQQKQKQKPGSGQGPGPRLKSKHNQQQQRGKKPKSLYSIMQIGASKQV